MVLVRVRQKRKDALAEARAFRQNLKQRGIKDRRIVVRKLSFRTVRKLTRPGIKVSAKNPGFGILFFDKKKKKK